MATRDPQESLFQGNTLQEGAIASRYRAFREDCQGCTKCALSQTRKRVVVGHGTLLRPWVMIVGLAPSAVDEEAGLPFQGPIGDYALRMIASIKLPLEQIYWTTLSLCRPPQTRDPQQMFEVKELETCRNNLRTQVEIINPYVLLVFGNLVANILLQEEAPIRKWRTQLNYWEGRPMQVTHAPSVILQSQDSREMRKEAYQDLLHLDKLVRSRL